MLNTIIITTTNKGKIQEIEGILRTIQGFDCPLESLAAYTIPEPDEPYEDFVMNATHKAKYYAQHLKKPALADDAGLCIDALNGFPGVRTKEFAQECGGDKQAFAVLADKLQGATNYTAHFTCALALYLPDQDVLITHKAQAPGRISFPARGDGGFGFDPLFIPEGYDKTWGELGLGVKNTMSHRHKAFQGLATKLQAFLEGS